MIAKLLLSPPLVFLCFLFVIVLGYIWIGKHTPKGKDNPEKHLPYSSGQNLPQPLVQLSYQAFFRLGLLFAILHVAALVISTMPFEGASKSLGLFYLIGISISAYVLVTREMR